MRNDQERGRQASITGFAHEHIVAGILMKRYHNVSLVDLPLSRYDLVIVRIKEDGTEDFIRAQVKTATRRISFSGGMRGGVDREYKSGVKEYIQSTKISDVVIGVNPIEEVAYDLYFVPTILVEKLGQKSISLNKIQRLKNNYEFLEICKDYEFVIRRSEEYGIISG